MTTYVIYDKETTLLLNERKSYSHYAYDSVGAAKAAITRMVKKSKVTRDRVDIADRETFFATIEKKEIRHGVISADGKEFTVGVNTPWSSGPWSESYWCN